MQDEIEEVVKGKSLINENQEYDLFLFKTKQNKYICHFDIKDIYTNESHFSSIKEFESLELAEQEYQIWDFEETGE